MVLADTSVWIEHFRAGRAHFQELLAENAVSIHPVVIGELAMGNLRKRAETLAMLRCLPSVSAANFDECLEGIESDRLYGRGIGWLDVQLLVSARLSGTPLWSHDRRLQQAASRLGLAYKVPR
jgi:predicted nucleic acid-binding protein